MVPSAEKNIGGVGVTSEILVAHFEESASSRRLSLVVFSAVELGERRARREMLEMEGRLRRVERMFEPCGY